MKMTRAEAEAFLQRNPKITREALAKLPLDKFENCFDFVHASNEKDARQDLTEVARALGLVGAPTPSAR